MTLDDSAFVVPLDGFEMRPRRSELARVAEGLGAFDASEIGDEIVLVEALRRLPARDRAPTWELAMRRFGHGKSLEQAAGEIGIDAIYARSLLAQLAQTLTTVPAPEHEGLIEEPAPSDARASAVVQLMQSEILSNAEAHGESVDLDARHEASLQAVEANRRRAAGPTVS